MDSPASLDSTMNIDKAHQVGANDVQSKLSASALHKPLLRTVQDVEAQSPASD